MFYELAIGKKTIACLISFAMLVTLCPVMVFASDVSTSYTSGDWTYTLDEEGNATITEFALKETAKEATVPDSLDGHVVTGIGRAVFGCYYNLGSPTHYPLESIVIPESVTYIGTSAFAYTNIECIAIPDGVSEIYPKTFEGCKMLKSIAIPNSVTSIGREAFKGCRNLSVIAIPEGVLSIDAEAFTDCRLLKTITIPASVNFISDHRYLNSNGCSVFNINTFGEENKNSYATLYVQDGSYAQAWAAERSNSVNECLVAKQAESIELSENDVALIEGSDFELSAEISPPDTTDKIAWTSYDTSVVTIEDGKLHMVGVGTTHVRATAGSVYAECAVRVGTTSFDPAQVSDIPSQVYTGDALTPAPAVTLDGSTLVKDRDYSLSYEQNTNAGKGKVTVTGISDYVGSKTVEFEIKPAQMSSASVLLDETEFGYDGSEKIPSVTVKLGDRVVPSNNYNVSLPIPDAVEAGKKTLVISGRDNLDGQAQVSYAVAPAVITAIELNQTEYTCDGTQKRPTVAVMCGNKTLVEDTDYTAVYPVSSAEAGTYTVTVTGKGNYTGTKQATFEIVEASKPTPDEPKPDDPGSVDPKPDDPNQDNPGVIDPKPDDPGTQPDNPGTTDPGPGNPGTQPEGPGATDPQPDDPGTVAPEPVATQVMYRVYNPNSGEHFYTASYGEVEAIVAAGWQYEGEAWTAPVTSAVPVYRLYSGTDHHYTTSAYERDELLKVGWSDEGIGWYSDDNEGVGLHRLFNPNVDPNAPRNNSGSHHYTTSDEERDYLVSLGWRYEDFGWYGVK